MTEDASRKPAQARSNDNPPLDEETFAKYGRIVGVVVVLLAAVGTGFTYGPSITVLVLTAGLLFGAILSLWTSIRALFGETKLTGEDAFALGAPTAEHEQKRAVLRAIKDLEFERTVGKISEEDYAVLMGRYRAEAKRLLRVLDDRAAPARARVEKLVEEHLSSLQLVPASTDSTEETDDGPFANAPDGFDEEMEDEEDDFRLCPKCDAENDPDAVFCKKCATRLTAEGDDDSDGEPDSAGEPDGEPDGESDDSDDGEGDGEGDEAMKEAGA